MFAPRVFVSMIGVLVVFAIVTFFLTGSAWTTVWQTLACAILLQVGYFIGVTILVAKAEKNRREATRGTISSGVAAADETDAKTIRVQSPPHHFNS